VATNITVHSCGGSRGFDRVPFLASASAEEPRKRKATHAREAGQQLQRRRYMNMILSYISRDQFSFKKILCKLFPTYLDARIKTQLALERELEPLNNRITFLYKNRIDNLKLDMNYKYSYGL